MWVHIKESYPTKADPNPFTILDPVLALSLVGYSVTHTGALGQALEHGKMGEIAGIIDNQQMLIAISTDFSHPIQNFTTAHELGHALLHQGNELHRDRPLDGSNSKSRSQIDYEADKLAACFLMPKKFLSKIFVQLFGVDHIRFDDHVSVNLGLTLLLPNDPTLREFSRLVARAPSPLGGVNEPIAALFQVSIETMAIRLEELGLVSV